MDFNELINDGWARHDSETEAVLAQLEANVALADAPDKAVPFIMLATHTAGAHAGDWQRGAALAQYEQCRRWLADELALEPEADTTALFEAIRTGALGSAARASRVTHAELPPAPRHNLPAQTTAFVGREAELAQIAEGSGLQWVNSDVDKIAAAQAAIAAEPKPVHVPRERPPVVVIDEGPLVLVETRKDLRNLQLPF